MLTSRSEEVKPERKRKVCCFFLSFDSFTFLAVLSNTQERVLGVFSGACCKRSAAGGHPQGFEKDDPLYVISSPIPLHVSRIQRNENLEKLRVKMSFPESFFSLPLHLPFSGYLKLRHQWWNTDQKRIHIQKMEYITTASDLMISIRMTPNKRSSEMIWRLPFITLFIGWGAPEIDWYFWHHHATKYRVLLKKV